MDIQLVIKAPNQFFTDHIVHCNIDWTIQNLKDHLAEFYPNKPLAAEQKLIYSGRLLTNHLHLKDVLRHDDNESPIHILHLVCKSNSSATPQQRSYSSQRWSSQQATRSQVNAVSTGQSSENTLRHRNLTTAPTPDPNPTLYQGSNFSPTMSAFIPDSQVAGQIAAMQQMYAYYFTQYIQSINPPPDPGNNSVFPDMRNYQQPLHPTDIPNQRQENQRNAQGLLEENDEMVNRDWLDHLFLCCRFVILFCVIYFYSTPERLMIVIVCAIIAFLYHEGWFVRRPPPAVVADIPQGNLNNMNVPPDLQNDENEPLLIDEERSANDELNGEHELEAAMDGDDPPHAQRSDAANSTHIFSPLTFLSTFFTSLIPDPPPPVNIN